MNTGLRADTPSRRNLVTRIMSAVTFAATVTGLLYYFISLTAPLLGTHFPTHAAKDDPFVEFDSRLIANEPWAKGEWKSNDRLNATLRVEHRENVPVVVVTGLVTGSLQIHLNSVSFDGTTYRGEAICAEHGGRIAPTAYLFRLPDNRMRLKIDPRSEFTTTIDLFLSHVNSEN